MQSTFIIPQELVNENVSVLTRKHHCSPTRRKQIWKKKGGGSANKTISAPIVNAYIMFIFAKKGREYPPPPSPSSPQAL